MVHTKGKTIIYIVPESNQLGQVSPYLFVERLADELVSTWPQIKVRKAFASKKKHFHQIYCVLPNGYTDEQVRLIKAQIEMLAGGLLVDLQKKMDWAKIAG